MMNILRSILFVPGATPKRFDKAKGSGADLICIDLEDAVLPEDKSTARQAVIDYILAGNHDICVRINPLSTALGQQDLAALAPLNPAYIMLAKCETDTEVNLAQVQLGEQSHFIALIETINGLNNAQKIAQCSKVNALMFGGADMSAELRCEFSYQPLLFARSQLVVAAAGAQIDLIDVPYVNLAQPEGLIQETQQVIALGYTAKAAIHPNQISAIHQAFRPSDSAIEYAQAVVDAVSQDDAGVVMVKGRMVDKPIIIASRRILALAEQAK